jgi:hypothetical protein
MEQWFNLIQTVVKTIYKISLVVQSRVSALVRLRQEDYKILGQPRLHSETLSQKTKQTCTISNLVFKYASSQNKTSQFRSLFFSRGSLKMCFSKIRNKQSKETKDTIKRHSKGFASEADSLIKSLLASTESSSCKKNIMYSHTDTQENANAYVNDHINRTSTVLSCNIGINY